MKFLTTKGIAACIESIIKDSNDFIVIACPFLKIDDSYIERIKEAIRNNVKVFIIYGKKDLEDSEWQKLQGLHIDIKFLENLHAKCYMNEKTALITSMNLYDFSEKNNREIGIAISKEENKNVYADVEKEMWSIYESAKQYNLESSNQYNSFNKSNGSPKKGNQKRNQKRSHFGGHCIRCGCNIPYDSGRPFCRDCYQIWSQFGNPDHPEKFCHKCGLKICGGKPIDYAHPLCYSCFNDGDYDDGHFVFDDEYDDFDDDDDYDDF